MRDRYKTTLKLVHVIQCVFGPNCTCRIRIWSSYHMVNLTKYHYYVPNTTITSVFDFFNVFLSSSCSCCWSVLYNGVSSASAQFLVRMWSIPLWELVCGFIFYPCQKLFPEIHAVLVTSKDQDNPSMRLKNWSKRHEGIKSCPLMYGFFQKGNHRRMNL